MHGGQQCVKWIDGLDLPEAEGTCGFLLDSDLCTPGSHIQRGLRSDTFYTIHDKNTYKRNKQAKESSPNVPV